MNKKGKYLVVVLAVVLFSTGCARTHCVGGRFYSGYDPQLPLNGKIEKEETLDSYRRIKFSFDGISGESVPSLMAYPISGESPRPCIIFIHGIRQNKEFLDRIAEPFVNAVIVFFILKRPAAFYTINDDLSVMISGLGIGEMSVKK